LPHRKDVSFNNFRLIAGQSIAGLENGLFFVLIGSRIFFILIGITELTTLVGAMDTAVVATKYDAEGLFQGPSAEEKS